MPSKSRFPMEAFDFLVSLLAPFHSLLALIIRPFILLNTLHWFPSLPDSAHPAGSKTFFSASLQRLLLFSVSATFEIKG